MKELLGLLRTDIEHKIGFKINSKTESKIFHQLLLDDSNTYISISTIRRFFGLTTETKPNQNTLNKLSKFIGFNSFLQYSKNKNRYLTWFDETEIQKIKFKKKLDQQDFKLIQKHYKTTGSNFFVANLIETAITQKKWTYINEIMNPKNIFLMLKNTTTTSYTIKLAYFLALFLNNIPKNNYENTINELIKIVNFKQYCFYIYIDLININNNYGYILKTASLTKISKEEKLFINLISSLGVFLTTGEMNKIPYSNIETNCLPNVLIGRLYGYQIAYSIVTKNKNKEINKWDTYLKKLKASNNKRDLIHEFLHHMILIKEFNKLETILVVYHDEVFDNRHVHSYLDRFIFNLIDTIVSLKNNEYKRAKNIFIHLETEKIKDNSYCDYYLIFYNIVGFHLFKNKETFLENYLTITKKAGFKLFNKNYIINFFD